MKDEWLRNGPPWEELVSEVKDERQEKADMALVIPSYSSKRMLEEHMRRLSRQTFQRFHVIVVYGENDEFVGGAGRMVHLREHGKNGCAGAYYTGEKYALEGGYKIIVLADNDCLPESDGLLGRYAAEMERGAAVVLPTIMNPPLESARPGSIIHHYGCIRRDVLGKAGLTFLPLYFGGEDSDLIGRIVANGFNIRHVEEMAAHPAFKPALISGEGRKYYCGRGELEAIFLAGNFTKAVAFVFLYCMAAAAYGILGRKSYAGEMLRSVWDAGGMRFFANVRTDLIKMPSTAETGSEARGALRMHDADAANETRGGSAAGMPGGVMPDAGALWNSLPRMAAAWNRPVVFINSNKPTDIPAMLVAKESHLWYGGRTYRLIARRGAISIIFSLAVLGTAAPFMLAAAPLIAAKGFITKALRRISSSGYGTSGLP